MFLENKQVEDYTILYSGTIKPLVEAADTSRPFLLSSPSNGVRTEELDLIFVVLRSERGTCGNSLFYFLFSFFFSKLSLF